MFITDGRVASLSFADREVAELRRSYLEPAVRQAELTPLHALSAAPDMYDHAIDFCCEARHLAFSSIPRVNHLAPARDILNRFESASESHLEERVREFGGFFVGQVEEQIRAAILQDKFYLDAVRVTRYLEQFRFDHQSLTGP
jgi:hypothetical protein